MKSILGFKSSKNVGKSSTVGVEKLTTIPPDTSMHASLTLSKVNLYQHSEWNSVITKLIELKITPEDALRILRTRKNQPNTVPKLLKPKLTAQKQQKHDLSNQSDNLTKRKTIIAEFTVTVDLMNVPDEINLKHKIKFEVVNNYNSGKVVKSEYETTLIPSIENIINMSDHKSSISKPEIGESIENVFPNVSDQYITLTQNPVIGLKDHLNSRIIGSENEYNVLLLGEIGVGKSTFINAFANYMKYSDFETAKNNKFDHLIPPKFTVLDPETGKSVLINSGMDDENEQNNKVGTSSTKAPMTYTFQLRDRTLRIIDTPGIGDINGINADRENFEQILSHLNNYNELHGILLLIKTTDSRKTTYFKYYITELFRYLHPSAFQNLIFCFTFSRNSFFGPGEGFENLRSFFDNELKDVHLKLKQGENCFFIDNEAYRFLVAQKQGLKYIVEQEESYRESWNKSFKQVNKMWDRVTRTAPHNLENTISLNNVRNLILEIAEQIVVLHTMIKKIKTKKDSIKVFDDEFKQLETTIEKYNYELTPINDIRSKFVKLLITNSNIPYNKFTEYYLDLLMKEELIKVESVSGYSRSKYESLKQMKDTHLKNVQVLKDAINSNKEKSVEPVELKDIFKFKDVLIGLKQSGTQFRKIFEEGSFVKKKNIPEKFLDLRNVTQAANPKE